MKQFIGRVVAKGTVSAPALVSHGGRGSAENLVPETAPSAMS